MAVCCALSNRSASFLVRKVRELLGPAQQPEVELVDLAGRAPHEAVVALRGKQEPDDRQADVRKERIGFEEDAQRSR
jgi:hypothetical protein